jgi:hypothetical protein
MFEFIVSVFIIYIILTILTSFFQISYIKNKLNKKAII